MCNKLQRHQPAFIMKTWGCSEGGGRAEKVHCLLVFHLVMWSEGWSLAAWCLSLSLYLSWAHQGWGLGFVPSLSFVFWQHSERTLSLGTSILRLTFWSWLLSDCCWIPTAGWPHRTRCSHRTQKTSVNAQSKVLNLVDVDHPEHTPCFTHAQTC